MPENWIPSGWCSSSPILLTRSMIACGVGRTVILFTETHSLVFNLNTSWPLPLSGRPRYRASIVCSSSVLLIPPTCPCTHWPISISGHRNFFPVTISLDDIDLCTPPFPGIEFMRITIRYTISTIKLFGNFLYGIIIRMQRIRSLINLLFRSTKSASLPTSEMRRYLVRLVLQLRLKALESSISRQQMDLEYISQPVR